VNAGEGAVMVGAEVAALVDDGEAGGGVSARRIASTSSWNGSDVLMLLTVVMVRSSVTMETPEADVKATIVVLLMTQQSNRQGSEDKAVLE